MPRALRKPSNLPKCPTGIAGLDEITGGGFPRGRTTLIAGGAGSGKTLVGMEFLINGAVKYGEPGVCMTFEENVPELVQNLASLGFDVEALVRSKRLLIDHVLVERHEIEETGEYDLEGLFIRLEHAVNSVGAKRILLDTIEVLFSGLENLAIVRSELRRLFRWMKDRGITAAVTAEAGAEMLTRHGLEEYVADCVVTLDHRVKEQVSTRRVRVVKYRGSTHGTNEYPFLIGDHGISVFPITSLGLTYDASTDRVSSGIEGLDRMLGGKGFYRNSSVLVSGTAGTGKSSIGAAFVNAACARGERALYFAFEESPSQILRNMSSVGMDLERWMKKGLLRIVAARPTSVGLESHLAGMHRDVDEFKPAVAVVDPITNLVSVGELNAVKAMLTRLVDYLKMQHVTALFTNLNVEGLVEMNTAEISSLMDVWILLRSVEQHQDRRRMASVLKARGMAHSAQLYEMEISSEGVKFLNSDAQPVAVSAREQGLANAQKRAKRAAL
jgi:circadian clock protein KaiC